MQFCILVALCLNCGSPLASSSFIKFIYLLHSAVTIRYEKKYMEEAKLKSAEQENDQKAKENSEDAAISKPEGAKSTQPLKKATSSSEQDLDVFLLGDLGDSDDGPGAFSTSTVLTYEANIFCGFNVTLTLLLCCICTFA